MADLTTRRVGRPVPGAPRSVAEVLDGPLGRVPRAEALVGRRRRYTYAELDAEVNRAAHALDELGVGPGDRVAACLGNEPELVVAFLAVMRLGAVWVGVNRVLTPAEKAVLLADAAASVLLAEPSVRHELAPHAAGLRGLHTVDVVLAGRGDGADEHWDLLLSRSDPSPRWRARRGDLDPYAPAAIAYTSGTTGAPKGVVHSQHNLVTVGAANRVWGGWRAVARQGAVLPLTILNVVALCPLLVFQLDGTCVCVDRRDPLGLAEWVALERIESFSSVPTIVHDLVNSTELRDEDLASLSHIGAGGGALPPALAGAYRDRFGRQVLAGYGLTEAPAVVTTQTPETAGPSGGAGRPLPHLRLSVRDGRGEPVAAGDEGEIWVEPVDEGPLAGVYTPFLGYWGRPPTDEVVTGAILRTGDLGHVDDDGTLFVHGRRQEVIVRGGSKISPAEVEQALRADRRVVDAAVAGRPDVRLGEAVVAWVQLAPGSTATPAELLASCAGRVARYKVPARLHLVDRFERNAMGKIRKAALPDPPGS